MLLVPQLFCLCVRAHLSVNTGVSRVAGADSHLQSLCSSEEPLVLIISVRCSYVNGSPAEWYVGPRPMTSHVRLWATVSG